MTPYIGAAGSNYHAHPVEGVAAFVDLTNRKILDFVDVDRDAPVTRHDEDFDAGSVRPLRPPAPPIQITTPQGPGYRIEDGEVRWEKWRFRFALHPREGLVLYTVGYDDGGRTRSGPVPRRRSPKWPSRTATPAAPGSSATPSTPANSASASSPPRSGPASIARRTARSSPRPSPPNPASRTRFPRAVGLYERETSIAWKHGQETRPARDLVLFYSSQAGNYEYGFQ